MSTLWSGCIRPTGSEEREREKREMTLGTNTKFSYYEVEIDGKVYPFTGGLKLMTEVL